MSRTQILTIGIDKVTMAEAVERCLSWIGSGRPHLVFTPNAEFAYKAAQDPAFASIINNADLVIADGIGIVLASRILGDPVPEKVAGAELSTNLVAALSKQHGRIYLLGTRPEVVAEAARRLQERFPGIEIAGYHDGFFKPEEEAAIIADIRAARPDALFVALGMPRQELWLRDHLAETGATIGVGVGGTIDVWAGVASRGPEWMQKAGLEWAYRIVKHGRYGRSLPPLAKFMLAVVARRLRGQ